MLKFDLILQLFGRTRVFIHWHSAASVSPPDLAYRFVHLVVASVIMNYYILLSSHTNRRPYSFRFIASIP